MTTNTTLVLDPDAIRAFLQVLAIKVGEGHIPEEHAFSLYATLVGLSNRGAPTADVIREYWRDLEYKILEERNIVLARERP